MERAVRHNLSTSSWSERFESDPIRAAAPDDELSGTAVIGRRRRSPLLSVASGYASIETADHGGGCSRLAPRWHRRRARDRSEIRGEAAGDRRAARIVGAHD